MKVYIVVRLISL